MTWLLAFGLTLLVEVTLAIALAPRRLRGRVMVDATLLNACTQPLLTLALRLGIVGFGPGEVVVA